MPRSKQFTLTGRHAGAFKKLDSLRSRIARIKQSQKAILEGLEAQEAGAQARCMELFERAGIGTFEFVVKSEQGDVTRRATRVQGVKHCIDVEAFEKVCEGVIHKADVAAAIERSVSYDTAKKMLDADALAKCDQPVPGKAYIRITGNRGRAADQE